MEAEKNLSTLDSKAKKELAVIPLVDVVVFPRVALTLIVKREKTLKALDYAMQHDQMAVCTAQKKDVGDKITKDDLYSLGTLAKIREITKQPDGSVRIVVEGMMRARITEFLSFDPFIRVKVLPAPEPMVKKTERIEALMYSLINQFKECVSLGATVPFDVMLVILNITDPWELADLMTINLDFKVEEKQEILEVNVDLENEIRQVQDKLSAVKLLISDQPVLVDALVLIYTLLPTGTYLDSLSIDNNKVTANVTASSTDSFTQFLSNFSFCLLDFISETS